MANIQDLFENQNRIEETLALRMADFEKTFKAASSSESKPNLDQLAQDYRCFKESVLSILQTFRSQIQALTLHTDELETYNRRNALLFTGIEEMDGEDCKSLITNVIQSTMNLTDIQASNIYFCHRLGAKKLSGSRPILVRFHDITIRNTIWAEKRRLKSSSTVLSEFLTKPRQAIFGAARKHFGINRCWSRDGAIFIKLPNEERKRIATRDDLDQLTTKFPSSLKSSSDQDKDGAKARPAAAASAAATRPPVTRRNISRAKTAK